MIDAIGKLTPAKSFLTAMMGNQAKTWTTLGGGVLIFGLWQISLVSVVLAFPLAARVTLGQSIPTPIEEAIGIGLLLLLGFGPAFMVLGLWRALMEKKRFSTLFSARPTFRWRLALASAFIVGLICLSQAFLLDPKGLALIEPRLARFSAQDWLLLALVYGVGICIQATFEEVFVRGWLLQHIARFVPTAIGAVLATSVVFSALHFGHPGWATYVSTFIFGLAFGWSAIRLNGLEAAIGAHIANNLVGALLMGQMVGGNPAHMDVADFALLIAYLLGFLLFVEAWVRFFEKPSRA